MKSPMLPIIASSIPAEAKIQIAERPAFILIGSKRKSRRF
jgi:hypothetical protein